MKLLSAALLLTTIVNLTNGTPEIKGVDPSQRFETPTFLKVQEQRYAEAVKERNQYRPLRTQVVTPRYESRGRESWQYGRQPAQPQRTDQYESYGRSRSHSVTSVPVIPQRTERHETYVRRNHLIAPTPIPQRTDRHETYGRRNQLIASTPIPQKTDRHERPNQGIGRNIKDRRFSYRTEEVQSRRPNAPAGDVEELWSTMGGSVKSEITDTRLKLTRPRSQIEGVKG